MIDYKTAEHPKVLVVALSGIGNLLMQTPMIRRLKESNPTAEISVMVAPRGTKDVLTHNQNIKNVFEGFPKPNFQQRLEMLKVIRREKFDVGIVAFPGQLITSSSLLYFSAIRQRIGHRYNYHLLKNTGLFLTHAFPLQPVHDVQQNLNLLEKLSIAINSNDTAYDFPLSLDDQYIAQTFLETNHISGEKLIGIHPGTNADMIYKRWPTERWAKLADFLAEKYNAKILIFGDTNENPLKDTVTKLMRQKPLNVALSLRGTAALIGKCRLFVSNDSGLMHIAVSQKVPTFGLFGPTDETRTAPWGKFGHIIRAVGTKPTYDFTKLREIQKLRTADLTLIALDVETVFDQIVKAIPVFSDSANNASS